MSNKFCRLCGWTPCQCRKPKSMFGQKLLTALQNPLPTARSAQSK